jgi:hypothetical protein
MSAVETIKDFIGEMGLEDAVIRLAVQKSNLNIEDAVNILFDPDRVQDLMDELQREEEKQSPHDIVIVEEPAEAIHEEAKLNLIISNKAEYFDLLFELLNLGVQEITSAAWNLLV